MSTIEIELSKGFKSIIDLADLPAVSKRKWCANQAPSRPRIVYAVAKIPGQKKQEFLHRFIMGAKVGQQVDHIDGNPLNNSRSNLRLGTQSENMRNRRPKFGRKYKGVRKIKDGKFTVMICVGTFSSEFEAAVAYNAAALKFFGEFARLNNVEIEE